MYGLSREMMIYVLSLIGLGFLILAPQIYLIIKPGKIVFFVWIILLTLLHLTTYPIFISTYTCTSGENWAMLGYYAYAVPVNLGAFIFLIIWLITSKRIHCKVPKILSLWPIIILLSILIQAFLIFLSPFLVVLL